MKIDWTKYKYIDYRIQDNINQGYIQNGDYQQAIDNLAFCYKCKRLFSSCCGAKISEKLQNVENIKYEIELYKTLAVIRNEKKFLNRDLSFINNFIKLTSDNIKKLK